MRTFKEIKKETKETYKALCLHTIEKIKWIVFVLKVVHYTNKKYLQYIWDISVPYAAEFLNYTYLQSKVYILSKDLTKGMIFKPNANDQNEKTVFMEEMV